MEFIHIDQVELDMRIYPSQENMDLLLTRFKMGEWKWEEYGESKMSCLYINSFNKITGYVRIREPKYDLIKREPLKYDEEKGWNI